MIIAAAYIPLLYSIGPAVIGLGLVIWYWLHLSRENVPLSRRRIRRVSLAIIAVTIPLLLTALSVVDPQQQASAYVIVWSVCALCLLLIVATAIIDAINNIRLHREVHHEQLINTAVLLSRTPARSDTKGLPIDPRNNGSAHTPSAKAHES